MKADLLIENAYIVTLDAEDTVYPQGSIAIVDGKIIAVDDTSTLSQIYDADKTIDCQGKMAMPGLINTHTHAPMSIFRGLADDMPLDTWLNDYIFPAEAAHVAPQTVKVGAQLSIMEMLLGGTTLFADMYYFEEEVAAACRQLGMKGLLSEGLLDFAVPGSRTPAESLAKTQRLAEQYAHDPLVSIALGPHAPYTCSLETMDKARQLANRYNLPIMLHVSETSGEYQRSLAEHGKTPLCRLYDAGMLDGRSLLAHCVYMSEDDLRRTAAASAGIAHCPVSNLKLASGVAPVPDMRAMGIAVGIGTDGPVSNNSLDMFGEMKSAALVAKWQAGKADALDARAVLRMATIDGARALGMDDKIGSLEAGKSADIVLVDLNAPHLNPLYNIYSQIVYAMKSSDVHTVLINGRIVVEDRKIAAVDAFAIYEQAQRIANAVADKLQ